MPLTGCDTRAVTDKEGMKTNHTLLLREGYIKNVVSVEIRLLCENSFLYNITCRNVLGDKKKKKKKDFPQDFPFLVLFSSTKGVREMEVNKIK